MTTTVQKWGNSQGLRIPKHLMREARLAVGDEVDVVLQDGALLVRPRKQVRGRYDLRALVARIPKGYRPMEVDWGKPQGREVW